MGALAPDLLAVGKSNPSAYMDVNSYSHSTYTTYIQNSASSHSDYLCVHAY